MIEIKDKVKHFLKDNQMYHEDIDMDMCCDIFIKEINYIFFIGKTLVIGKNWNRLNWNSINISLFLKQGIMPD